MKKKMTKEFKLIEKIEKLKSFTAYDTSEEFREAVNGIEKDVKEFIKKLKEGNRTQLVSLLNSILLWFLSDNIKVDEKRLKRLFEGYLRNGFIDNLAGDLKWK